VTEPATPTFEEVEVGTELPTFTLDVTTTTIVVGAIASRDFYPGHHDRDYAQRAGMDDVFMNILTTNGWVARYLSDWTGPHGILRRLQLRLGVPNYPGDTMVLTGRVTGTRLENGSGTVEVEFTGANGRGNHVTGHAVVELPRGAGAGRGGRAR
jgi:acyl dehydratase